MAFPTYHERFSVSCCHNLRPRGMVKQPLILHISKFANVVYFNIFFASTQFTGICQQSFYKFRSSAIHLIRLVPSHSKTQPIFSLIMKLNLYDSIWGVTLVYLSAGMAMSIFVLKAGFMAIPKSLDEAATLDGASFFRTFWTINLPLAKSALATAGILMFLGNWNEYYFASLLTVSDSQRTLPIALAFFTSEFSYNYTQLFAALTIVILPGIILYALAQDQVQASVAASGVKG